MLKTNKENKLVKIRVLRPFYFDGVIIKKNTVKEFEASFAAEMVSASKAIYVEDEPKADVKKQ